MSRNFREIAHAVELGIGLVFEVTDIFDHFVETCPTSKLYWYLALPGEKSCVGRAYIFLSSVNVFF